VSAVPFAGLASLSVLPVELCVSGVGRAIGLQSRDLWHRQRRKCRIIALSPKNSSIYVGATWLPECCGAHSLVARVNWNQHWKILIRPVNRFYSPIPYLYINRPRQIYGICGPPYHLLGFLPYHWQPFPNPCFEEAK
jgi:hypothetical protein